LKTARIFNIVYAICVLLAYSSVLISPGLFWPAAFLALSVPFIILIEIGRLIYLSVKRSINFIFPLLLLVIAYPFVNATTPILKEKKDNSSADVKVLSYNARIFNLYENKPVLSESMIDWVIAHEADIKCFQEYYNLDKDIIYGTTERISEKGKWYHFVQPTIVNRIGGEFGLAIFSRYPIIARGIIDVQKKSTNSAIFADIDIGGDTIRIINIHLQSIGFVDEDFEIKTDQKVEGVKNIAEKLKVGFLGREKQLKKLEVYLEKSEHPVIICGDLNDTPYSYAYFKIRRFLYNAFEEKGNGFGFSYDETLSFLRIDHQFFSEHFDITTFKTDYGITFSDHFPLIAGYQLKKRKPQAD